jgi:predicted nuclease with TOPRIM domain
MDENGGRPLSVDIYITRQESLLVEHIRKFLQAETKIALLEGGLQELHKKNKDLLDQIDVHQMTIDQSLNGLKAVTMEKDKLAAENESISASLKDCKSRLNELLVVKTELDQVKDRLKIAEDDYVTLKGNYNTVVAMLPENNTTEPAPSERKLKKKKNTESEWIDGQY